jgi:predicted MarR family transcription regulator
MAVKRQAEARKSEGELLSELEIALTVLWNSVRRWMSQRSKGSLIPGLSDLDVFLLHLLAYRDQPMRAIDLAFALSVDDMHLVTYSLKKLARLETITTERVGKEVFYRAADKGRQHYSEFLEDRSRYLEPAMRFLTGREDDLESLNDLLRTMSGVYEQAARAAATAKASR